MHLVLLRALPAGLALRPAGRHADPGAEVGGEAGGPDCALGRGQVVQQRLAAVRHLFTAPAGWDHKHEVIAGCETGPDRQTLHSKSAIDEIAYKHTHTH